MSTPIIISLVALVVVLFIAAKFFGSNKDQMPVEKEGQASEVQSGVSLAPELQKLYERGINPDKAKDLTFYTLTNCVHCDRLEKFLINNEIPYSTILLDEFSGMARKEMMDKVRFFNPRGSFPTLVSPEGEVTIGFREWQVREKFMKYSLRNDDVHKLDDHKDDNDTGRSDAASADDSDGDND